MYTMNYWLIFLYLINICLGTVHNSKGDKPLEMFEELLSRRLHYQTNERHFFNVLRNAPRKNTRRLYNSDEDPGLYAHATDFGTYYDNELWYPEPDHPQNGSVAPKCYFATLKLNHFADYKSKTFKLRYCCNRQFYVDGGPILFMIGGNHPINNGFLMTGVGYDIAEYTKAALCFIEHRFYGESNPFGKLTLENLNLLSIGQALEDIITVISGIKERFHANKIGVLGCNYGGRLATYLRLKFPNVVDAAYVSSVPLISRLIFNEGFESIQDSVGLTNAKCLQIIRDAVKQIEEELQTNRGRRYVEKIFNMCSSIDRDGILREGFFYNFAFSLSYMVRQGSPGRICMDCKYILRQRGRALEKLATYFRWKRANGCMATYEEVVDKIKNVTAVPSHVRQRNYQICATQVGSIRSSASNNQPFGSNVSPQYGYQFCKDSFGNDFSEELINNRAKRMNLIYGGTKPEVTNVVFVYGTADAQYLLGYSGETTKSTRVFYIKGGRACGDMYTNKDGELDSVVNIKVKAKLAFIDMLLRRKNE